MGISTTFFKNGIAQEEHDFKLTDGQCLAVKAIKSWYRNRGLSPIGKNYFVLAGAAGTGKTSIISAIRQSLNLAESSFLCCAYTGKASLNILRKGSSAKTVHSAIYNCHVTEDDKVIFERKDSLPYGFIIVDEASMISKEIFDDLMSFQIPTVFIGDHCQLPPVGDDFNLMLNPDYILTEIMRQAKESPIIRASQLAINGKPIPFCSFGGFRKIRFSELEDEDFLHAEQIVTGTNKTRHLVNEVCRELYNFSGINPQVGERMIVLQNNPKYKVFNGQIVYIDSTPQKKDGIYFCEWKDELEFIDPAIAIIAKKKRFKFAMAEKMYKKEMEKKVTEHVILDFGYAATCHKSQGSGWERVLVIDEHFGFDEETRRRWLYTAITRAKQELLIAEN